MFAHNAEFRVWLATPDAADRLDAMRLSADEAALWQQMRTPRRRQDWASSRALLAHVPSAGPHSRSLTHSHGFAGLLTAPPQFHVGIGIDIEPIKPRDFIGMAGIAFPSAESDHLASLDPATQGARFYELWTLKEAFAKALGLPLTEALATCRCVDDLGQIKPSMPTSKYWRAAVFAPRPHLRLAVALVAESIEQLQVPILNHEWPVPAADRWPLVIDLIGIPTHLRCDTASVTVPGR